nr:hypothetical protein CFP56_28753 [Quercus suber]
MTFRNASRQQHPINDSRVRVLIALHISNSRPARVLCFIMEPLRLTAGDYLKPRLYGRDVLVAVALESVMMKLTGWKLIR